MGNGQSQVITAANGETVLTKADIGKVSGLFPALYLGSTAIAGDGSQLTDEQCRAAVARIREPGLPTRKVKVVVGAKLVSVFNPETMVEIVRSSTPYTTVRTQVGESSSSIVVWVEFYGVGVPRLYAAQTHKSAQASNLLAALNLAAKRAAKLPKPDPPVAVQPAANGAAGRTPNKSGEGEKRGMGQRTESMRVAPPVQDLPEQTFKVSYRGSVPVQSKAGVDVATSALQQIRGQRLKQRAILGVSAAYIKVVDAKTREVITKAHLPELTFVTIDGLSTRTIAYIIDSGLGVLNCHGLKARGAKEAKAITEAIGTAIVTASNDQSGKLRMASAESRALARNLSVAAVGEGDASAPLGLFQATYLATVHVEVAASANKQAICNDAAFALHTQETLANQEVALVISGEGMKACETQSAQVISNTPIQNMSYVTVVEDKKLVKGLKKGGIIPKDAPLFAFINHDGRLARTTCELFFCGTRARELCETIGVAFQAAKEDQKRRKQNPFAAISQAREKVTGPLFKRQVHRRDLKAKEVVGMGQFGEVYSATQMVRAPGGKEAITEIPRAVKLLRKGASAKDRAEFLKEAETMLMLDHPNLVQFIGVSVQQRPWMVVLEYMEYGDLREVMRTCQEKEVKLTYLEQLKFAVQIATGMKYLSGLRFVHMDLAARNCLLGAQSLVKIADFGLTQKLDEGADTFTLRETLKLPIKWMAPESMDQKIFSPQSDVWAFGITLWEIMSYGGVPYGEIRTVEVQPKVRDGFRLHCPPDCPPEFYGVMMRCWDAKWQRRPHFDDLRKMILRIAKKARDDCPPLRDVGKILSQWDNSQERDAAEMKGPSGGTTVVAEENADFSELGPEQRDHDQGLPETDYDKTVNFVRVQPKETPETPDTVDTPPAAAPPADEQPKAAVRKKTKRKQEAQVASEATEQDKPNAESPSGGTHPVSNPFFKLAGMQPGEQTEETDTDALAAAEPGPRVGVSSSVPAEAALPDATERTGSLPGPAAWRLVCDEGFLSSAHVTDNGHGGADAVTLVGRVAF